MTIFTSLPAGKVKKNFRVGIFGAKNLGSVGLGETEDFFFKPNQKKIRYSIMLLQFSILSPQKSDIEKLILYAQDFENSIYNTGSPLKGHY